MSEGMARGALAGNLAEMSSTKKRVHCRECGSDRVYRVFRKGYFQEKIYPLFGYYPWRCMKCGVRVMLHKRDRAKKQDFAE
jgi:DNA-directed RNA polymerase subunit RPC12/RpoP